MSIVYGSLSMKQWHQQRRMGEAPLSNAKTMFDSTIGTNEGSLLPRVVSREESMIAEAPENMDRNDTRKFYSFGVGLAIGQFCLTGCARV